MIRKDRDWPGGLKPPDDGDVAGRLALSGARRDKQPYPQVVAIGVLFAVLEQAGKDWRVLATGEATPGGARDVLGSLFWAEAGRLARIPGADAQRQHDELLAAAGLLDWDDRNEVTAGGRTFRICRVEEQARIGPGGPEPSHPADTGLRARANGNPDPDRAFATYPQVERLPARFAPTEIRSCGLWVTLADSTASEQAARDFLVRHLDRFARAFANAKPADSASYAHAAAMFRQGYRGQATAGNRAYRVIPVEQIVRIGPSGPELADPLDDELATWFEGPGDSWPWTPDSP